MVKAAHLQSSGEACAPLTTTVWSVRPDDPLVKLVKHLAKCVQYCPALSTIHAMLDEAFKSEEMPLAGAVIWYLIQSCMFLMGLIPF